MVRELEQNAVWDDVERASRLGQERAKLEKIITVVDKLDTGLADARALLIMAKEENDQASAVVIHDELDRYESQLADLEFYRMFSGKMDANDAYLDIQSGSGGTEAQDWAEMLLRMYLRWCESKGFASQVVEMSPGEVAGIKSATISVSGEYAFGWLRTETGVHRLVRKSPFDSGNRRHTSFAAVFVAPEVDEQIEVDLNPKVLRVDTYRASGAGGQHVNKTDSAVRLTHLPSGVMVQCQSDRSQHKNKNQAMKMLRAKLYELEFQKRQAGQRLIEANKSDIAWGNQIRSYVLDQSRVRDLRTGVERANTQAVLDGELDPFITASLKSAC